MRAKLIKSVSQLIGAATAAAVFFQFHVALPVGLINLNLADPFALLALAAVSLHVFFSRKMPQWRVAEFNRMLLIIGVLLLIAYMVGWMKIGVTQWALSARLMGWVVLLGYLSVGYLLVAYGGNAGIRRMLTVLVIVAISVIVWHVLVRFLYGYGFEVSEPTPNFEGFSGNRNAFAFQLLAVLALVLPYSKVYGRKYVAGWKEAFGIWRSWVPIGFLIAGVVWTASRAGMLVATIMLLVAFCRDIADRGAAFFGVLFAGILWGIVGVVNGAAVQSLISGADSNRERWGTLLYGLEMWRHSPFLGEGLGVFIARSAELFGHPTVIHSTPVWILAEFGLMGAVVFGWVFLRLVIYALRPDSRGDKLQRSALLLLLVLFLVFSQFHELLFQRVFWLIGGALLAVPLVLRSQGSARAG